MPSFEIFQKGLQAPLDVHSIDEAKALFPNLNWRDYPGPSGNKTSFVVLDRDKETGELHVLAAVEKGDVPDHLHNPGGAYGELIVGLAGELHDVTDDGDEIVIRPGMILVHAGGTQHKPCTASFWLGYYHQPRGSEIVK